jgi:tRNA-(ms[2]io[6]A)-hydroxylase
MKELIRPQEPQRAVDRLLVAALIEARSCERFDLLRHHIDDVELSDFYDQLFESEARHYSIYVQLAEGFAAKREVELRLMELARSEAEIIHRGDTLPRMHS